MATSEKGSEPKMALEIRTKSVEQTLIPLVTQITTLVNARERPAKTEKMIRALVRVGQAVNMAVERFVSVGESIAEENMEIRQEMQEACTEARVAGLQIQRLTEGEVQEGVHEKTAMVRASRQLLSAITKVLILADKVVVKQLIAAKDKVNQSLRKIEECSTFTEFVQTFSQFGNEMVDLAQLSGERQSDLKSDKSRAQMGAARSVLEKSTMMLLTTSKAFLRHVDCVTARQNRDMVLVHMRQALDLVHQVVMEIGPLVAGDVSPTAVAANGDSGIGLAQHQPTAFRAIKEFEDLVETTRMTLVNPATETKLLNAVETVSETTQDFTDSAYTTHENRERIINVCDKVKNQLVSLVEVGKMLERPSQNSKISTQDLETAILKTREGARALRKQLQDTAMDQASEVFKTNQDHELLGGLKQAGLQGNEQKTRELSQQFQEHAEQIQEVCKLLRHISGTEALIVWSEHAENITKTFAPQIIHAASTLSQYTSSKVTKENIEVFCEAWAAHINDLSILVKDVNDVCQGRVDRTVYLSLPRPGCAGESVATDDEVFLPPSPRDQQTWQQSGDWNLNSNNNNSQSSCHDNTIRVGEGHCNSQEQARIAKLGLEMKLITSEMDAETEKWQDTDNEIVCRGKNMSSMAFSMYLFTRGEGPLKTTQDLFTQAQYFGEEGVRLYQCSRDLVKQVPQSSQKSELTAILERLPALCQRLAVTLKAPTVGKAQTFTKVDNVIQETKNLMNCVAKVVSSCLVCASKFNLDCKSRTHHSQWRPLTADSNGGGASDGSDRDSIKSGRSSGSQSGSSRVPLPANQSGRVANQSQSGRSPQEAGSKNVEPVRRSASLNSRPPPGAHPMQYMSDRL